MANLTLPDRTPPGGFFYGLNMNTTTINIPYVQADGNFGFHTYIADKFVPCEQKAACEAPAVEVTVEDYILPDRLKKKKDKKMSRYYDYDEDRYVDMSDILQPQTDLEKSRSYLRSRVSEIAEDTSDAQFKAFGLEDDNYPQTAAELVKRIQDGKFVLEDSTKDREYYDSGVRWITWRDPAIKKDQDGFTAAMKSFEKARTQALDTINTLDPTAGLEAVKTLEAWTPAA